MGRVHRLRDGFGGVSATLAAFAALAALVVAALVVAGCSSGHDAFTTSTSTTAATSTTTAPRTTTTLLAPATTTAASAGSTSPPSTAAPPTAPGTKPPGDRVSIDGFVVTPASPVSCNAPTSVELSWTSSGADAVRLAIDGSTVATYGPGAQDHLVYLPCDGQAHTYTLTASSGGARSTVSRTVSTQRR